MNKIEARIRTRCGCERRMVVERELPEIRLPLVSTFRPAVVDPGEEVPPPTLEYRRFKLVGFVPLDPYDTCFYARYEEVE